MLPAATALVLQRRDFAWARSSGGYLPFQCAGTRVREGREGACSLPAGANAPSWLRPGGFLWRRRDTSGEPLRRVGADNSEAEVA